MFSNDSFDGIEFDENVRSERRPRGRRTGRRDRSIETILARRRARRRRRKKVYPPDFLHGDCPVAGLHDAFGAAWAEGCAFVEALRDEQGRRVGWTIGRFDDSFLIVEQGLADEVDDLDRWLTERLDGARTILELALDATSDAPPATDLQGSPGDLLRIPCATERLLELERAHLHVTRDHGFVAPDRLDAELHDVLQESRLNVLSFVCLCAELI